MPTIHEVKARRAGPIGRPEGIVERLSREGKAQTRRRLVVRTGTWLALTAVAGFLVVVWQRNTRSIDDLVYELKTPAKAIEESVNQYGWLPASPPDIEGVKLQYYCNSEAERTYAMNAGHPTIIAFTPAMQMVLRGKGRGVLIYDKGQIFPKWLREAEFRRDWIEQVQARERFEEDRRSRPPELPE